MLRKKLVPMSCALAVTLAAASGARALPKESERWIRVRSAHFEIFSSTSAARAVEVARQLETLREVLGATTSGLKVRSAKPTRMYVFDTEDEFLPFRLGKDGKPMNQAGYFVPGELVNTMAVDASATSGPYRIAYHEYLHDVLHASVGRLPVWLDEGLAEFYSTFLMSGPKAILGTPVASHLEWIRHHPLLPMRQLMAIRHDSPEYNEGERQGTFYAESWEVVHWIVADDPARAARLGEFIKALGAGEDQEQAFERIFQVPLDGMVKFLQFYATQRDFGIFKYTPPKPFDAAAAQVQRMERAEVLYRLGDLLVSRAPIQASSAEEHLSAALALAPSHAGALASLALLRSRQDRLDEAVTSATRAAELDPKDGEIRALLGMLLLRRFAAHRPPDGDVPAALARARSELKAASELVPDHPEILAELGRSYLLGDDDPDADVSDGLQAMARASKLMPGRTDVIAGLAALMARSGNVMGAMDQVDRRLRPLGEPREIRSAESAVAWSVERRAIKAVEAGHAPDAERQIRDVASWVKDPEVQADLTKTADRIAAAAKGEGTAGERSARIVDAGGPQDAASVKTFQQLVSRYNEAVELGNRGKLEEALAILDEVASKATEPSMKTAVDETRGSLRAAIADHKFVERYNEAAKLARAGKRKEAAARLRELLRDGVPPARKAEVERALKQLE